MAATQINVFVNTQFAAGEGTGAISWLDHAFRVILPANRAVWCVDRSRVHPALSRLAATNNMPQVRTTVASAIGLMLALNVPATVGLIYVAVPIVALIFEHGQFTAADTAATGVRSSSTQ